MCLGEAKTFSLNVQYQIISVSAKQCKHVNKTPGIVQRPSLRLLETFFTTARYNLLYDCYSFLYDCHSLLYDCYNLVLQLLVYSMLRRSRCVLIFLYTAFTTAIFTTGDPNVPSSRRIVWEWEMLPKPVRKRMGGCFRG